MKISFLGIDVAEGKVKYKDDKLNSLVEKFSPQKVSPFFAEVVKEDFQHADCIVVTKEKVLDLLIIDIDKMETRLQNSKDEPEKQLVQKCLQNLEMEIPLCDAAFSQQEMLLLRGLAPLSLKPTLVTEGAMDVNDLIKKALEKSNMIFFYTAGKKEVKAWPVTKDLPVVECAGKIHSDLERGFIKAEIVNTADFLTVHNMQEAKINGLVKLVDRDYLVQDGDILDIRFNV
ncbi:MAG: DUF933 domain-containing protein [Candidatus Omnitrophica bacterium]|nr:DUF933 domain-containing protein [Candidatus Omnitrophota bacterium]MCG2704201.1 DUF933 domain-containing protein [Candidatus Omnitrophota bacterium]